MTAIVVAGGGAYHLYSGPFAGPVFISRVTAPPQGQDVPLIEHYFVRGSPNTATTPTATPPTTTAPAATTTTPGLPATGAELTGPALIGLVSGGVVLVLGGLAILLVLRRRQA